MATISLLFVIHLCAIRREGLLDGEREETPTTTHWRTDRLNFVPCAPFSFNLPTMNKVFPYLTERSLPQSINLQSSILLPLRHSIGRSIWKTATFFYPSVYHCSSLFVSHSFLCQICGHPSIFSQQNLQRVRWRFCYWIGNKEEINWMKTTRISSK